MLLTIAASHAVHVQIPAPPAQSLWTTVSAATQSATLASTAVPAPMLAPWAQSLLNNQYLIKIFGAICLHIAQLIFKGVFLL